MWCGYSDSKHIVSGMGGLGCWVIVLVRKGFKDQVGVRATGRAYP